MATWRRSEGWRQARALVLAAVVFIGGFGLPAFDAIAYHWRPGTATAGSALPRVQQYGTPAEHAVQCVITHNAPAPRLAAVSTTHLPVVATDRVAEHSLRPEPPVSAPRYSATQPRAPPARIA